MKTHDFFNTLRWLAKLLKLMSGWHNNYTQLDFIESPVYIISLAHDCCNEKSLFLIPVYAISMVIGLDKHYSTWTYQDIICISDDHSTWHKLSSEQREMIANNKRIHNPLYNS